MLVGISCEFLGVKRCGTATYTQSLLRGLASLGGDQRYAAYLAAPDGLPLVPQAPNIETRVVGPYSAATRLGLTLPIDLLRRPVDLFHANGWGPPWSSCPTVITIHDIGFERHPEIYPAAMRARLSLLVRHSARRALLVIAPSRHTAADLVELYAIPEARVRLIPDPMDPDFAPVTDPAKVADICRRYGITKPYILYVGSIEPKKNVHRLIEAYARLRRAGATEAQLVIAGKALWLAQPILALPEQLGIADNVRFTGPVRQEDLAALYTGAELFAFLGMYEGFGYPPLEAMACGAPVLAANRTSLGEVLGGAAMLVDPDQQDELAAALARLLTDAGLRAELRQQGFARVRLYQPEPLARRTAEVYAECYELARGPRRAMYER